MAEQRPWLQPDVTMMGLGPLFLPKGLADPLGTDHLGTGAWFGGRPGSCSGLQGTGTGGPEEATRAGRGKAPARRGQTEDGLLPLGARHFPSVSVRSS